MYKYIVKHRPLSLSFVVVVVVWHHVIIKIPNKSTLRVGMSLPFVSQGYRGLFQERTFYLPTRGALCLVFHKVKFN